MNRLLAVVLAAAVVSPISAADAPAPAAAPAAKPKAAKTAPKASGDSLKSEDEKTSYAYGFKVGQNLASLALEDAQIKALAQGLRDAAGGKNPAVDMATYLPKVSDMISKRVEARAAVEKKKGAEFAEKFSKEDGVKPITGGGWMKTLVAGNGATPTAADTVKVNYAGTLIDGKEFDSSYKRGEPATFPLGGVIPCWTNGVAQMKVGEKAKLVCPSDIAYGDQGHPPVIPGGSTLVFEVELLEIVKADAPAPAAPAKADAKKSDKKTKN